jgi:anti-sigma regulatory factor (Ser/Thr protein kinase)
MEPEMHGESGKPALPSRAPGARRCTLRAEYAALAELADWCAEMAGIYRLSRECANAVDLCLSELVTNVIDYAYAADGASPILVDANLYEGQFEITLWDAGPPFNPLDHAPPPAVTDLAEVRIGGLGIDLVRKFTGTVSYARVGAWNRLRFTPIAQ